MGNTKKHYLDIISQIQAEGLYKRERTITTPQGVDISTVEGGEVLNFCANNYLGLANHPHIIAAAKTAMDNHGFGMASVRFICGTQDLHKELESKISTFFGTDYIYCIYPLFGTKYTHTHTHRLGELNIYILYIPPLGD